MFKIYALFELSAYPNHLTYHRWAKELNIQLVLVNSMPEICDQVDFQPNGVIYFEAVLKNDTNQIRDINESKRVVYLSNKKPSQKETLAKKAQFFKYASVSLIFTSIVFLSSYL